MSRSVAEPATETPLLRLQGVSKAYRSASETTTVFEHLDLELRRGELTCMLGSSGCGKSTMISLVNGLMVPDAGQVWFDGQDLAGMSDSERAHIRATRIGIVLQSGNLVPFLTATENIELASRLADGGSSRERTTSLLEQVGLAGRADHYPRRLSGGEAQRVALAVALVNDPDLLLADEALGRLDSQTARIVLETLEQACSERGLAVLLVTHSEEVADLAPRTVRLVDGRIEEGQ